MQKILWICAAVCFAATGLQAAEQPAEKVRVVVFRVPEKIWQAELESHSADAQALWKKLDEKSRQEQVQRTADIECALPENQTPFEWKRGQDQEFTTSWVSDGDKVEVVPDESTQRFVGTLLTVASRGPTRGGRLNVTLRLEHDIRPPLMMKHNYANAAEGKERERLSVEYPQFERVVWQGGAAVGHEWRLLTQVLHPNPDAEPPAAQRYLLFITRI